jgi:hypothetical protein
MGVARISFAGRALTDFPPIFIAKNYVENAKPENRRAGSFFVGFLNNSHKNRKTGGCKMANRFAVFRAFLLNYCSIWGGLGRLGEARIPHLIY